MLNLPLRNMFEKKRIAAIDVGSNSVHMLLVEMESPEEYKIIDSEKEQVRLAASIDSDGNLNSDALNRLLSVLKKMKEIADFHGAQIRAVGTSALREAKNANDFVAKIYKKTGIDIEIISGHEEARLVYLGVQQGLPIQDKSTLIVDIGGGSTEIVVGQWGEERFATSLKLGSVRLTQGFIQSDPLSDENLRSLELYINTRLEPVLSEVERVGFDCAVGSSGTIKAVKSLVLGLTNAEVPPSLHGSILTAKEIWIAKEAILRSRSLKDRKQLPGLDSKRADIIVAGIFVLSAITKILGIREWMISLTAIREGILYDTMLRDGVWLQGDTSDIRWRSVRSFGQKFHIDEAHAFHITSFSVSLFDQLYEKHNLSNSWREYLRSAAYLHECGLFIGHTGHHKHTFYFIRNATLPGFTTREMQIIATIVRYHRKRMPRENDEVYCDFDKDIQKAVNICASILRLAVSLDRGRQGKIHEIKINDLFMEKMSLSLYMRAGQDIELEMYEAAIEKKAFENVFSSSLEIVLEH
ncbi:Ppx/GppA phosphatase family protein [Fluviispira vulneris]|uniref:Ppx/GppA phosphatase family protein n=1 Tax=Fluviispira vulneris TaxID=2763012 RepID=UPI0016456583|nr:Ppx/GppA phosphatase family protein [Fluviispira vulneris]